jgi:hypothetical protein
VGEYKYENVNPANPFISGMHAIKQYLHSLPPLTIKRDERLREVRYLSGQIQFSEEARVKNIDRYIASLLDEDKIDTPELEKIRDLVAEIGFAVQEQKSAIPANQLERFQY